MKVIFIVSLSLLLGMLISNCKKDVTPSYNLTLALVFPQGFTVAPMPGGVEVKITNVQTGREIVALTDASGKVTTVLAEGKYNIKSSFTVKANADEYSFNGMLGNYLMTKESAAKID